MNHQRIFFGDPDRIEFGERLADIFESFGVETLAYALMTNHYHLLLRTPTGGLSDAMHRLGLVYVKRTNDRVGRDGPLFRSRFHSIRVTTDAYLAFATRYIHRNPLDLPGITRVADYRWCSDRTYRGLRRQPRFMNTSVVLSLFGGDRKRLIRFTDADTAGFDEATPVGADDIRQLVQLAVGVRELSAGVDDRLPSWLERTAILLIGDAVAGQLRADIVDALEFSTPAAEQMARKRARERSAEPHLRRVLADVFAVLPPETRAA